MNIKDDIKQFLYTDHLKHEFEKLNDRDSLLERGIIDSVKMLDLIGFLEQQYTIRVEDDELYPENFDTLSAIETYVSGKIRNKRAGE
jgi:acyl carrier protein